MSQQVEAPVRDFPTGGTAFAKYLRVKLSGSALALAGANDQSAGVTQKDTFTTDSYAPVRLPNAPGTKKMVANGAITKYARVFAGASGKVSATVSGVLEGIALEAASADGDIIEVLPIQAVATIGFSKVTGGQMTTATATDTVVTGLTTVVAAIATFDDNPGDDPMLVSCTIGDQAGTPAAGSIIVKTWKNTGGTDPTPLAATTFSKKVNWIAFGT